MVAFVRSANGVRVAVPAGGLLIGRGSACGLIVDDPSVSRRHALVLSGEGGSLVIPLGRRATEVDGTPISAPTELRDGSRLDIGPAAFVIDVPAPLAVVSHLIELGGQRYSLTKSNMCVGGSTGDDLVVPSWAPRLLSIWPVPGAVVVEFGVPTPEVGAQAGEVRQLPLGEQLTIAGVSLRVIAGSADSAPTIEGSFAPSMVRLEFLPNGGLLSLTLDGEHTAWLADKRCDLVAALLRPTGELQPGELVPDELLVRLIWGTDAASRAQLNTLIHRARKSLTMAGLNGPALIQRAQGGGATRFSLAPNAQVVII
jgi:hypothetical protein